MQEYKGSTLPLRMMDIMRKIFASKPDKLNIEDGISPDVALSALADGRPVRKGTGIDPIRLSCGTFRDN